MKIVIELSDETYKDIKEENGIYGINNGLSARITGKVVGAIQSGTPLPKGHGLMDADEFINSLKGIEKLHIDDELRISILDFINAYILVEADKGSEG